MARRSPPKDLNSSKTPTILTNPVSKPHNHSSQPITKHPHNPTSPQPDPMISRDQHPASSTPSPFLFSVKPLLHIAPNVPSPVSAPVSHPLLIHLYTTSAPSHPPLQTRPEKHVSYLSLPETFSLLPFSFLSFVAFLAVAERHIQ